MKAKGEKMGAAEIKKLLKDLDWPQERLAYEVGVTIWAVHKWLQGISRPAGLRARKLREIREKYLGNGAAK